MGKRVTGFKELQNKTIKYISRKWRYLNLPQYRGDRSAVKQVTDDMTYDNPEAYDKRYLSNEADRYLHDRWHPFLISKIKGLCKSKNVFDLGCGTCEFTQHMKDAKLVVGLDASIHMLKYGARKVNCPNSILIHGDACKLPFKPKTADVTFCIGVLQWMDVRVLFSEIQRVIKDSGRFMLVFPNKWNLLSLQWRLLRMVARKLGRKTTRREEYSYREVRKSLADFGFMVKEMKSFGMLFYCPVGFQKYAKYFWILMDKVYAPFQKVFPLGLSIMVIAQKSN